LNTALLLAASMVVGQGDVAASEADIFKEYGRVMVGRWEGDVHFGDDVAAGRAVIRWIANGAALECEGQIGDLKVKWVGGWDAVSKTIRNLGVDSAGTMTETVIAKQGDRWVGTVTNLLADGTKRTNTDTMTISDRGKTHIHEGTSIGPKLSNYRGVWQRVEQEPGPDYAQLKAMQWLIGDWEADWVVPSEGISVPDGYPSGSKVRSFTSYSWMENKNYIGLRFRDEIDGKVVHSGFEMIGVDPQSKKTIHWLFSILGGWGPGEWTVEGKTWTLKWTGTTADGTKYEGVSFMVPVDANTHTCEMKECKKNGKPTPDTPLVTFRRASTKSKGG